jgi:hypothetical protein
VATKTSTQVKAELDSMLYEDVADSAPWEVATKRLAINRAIRGSYPHFKLPTFSTSTTLASGTYVYTTTLTSTNDLGGYAICQVYLEPETGDEEDWRPLRRCTQDWNGTYWRLHVPPDIVENNDGHDLRIHYYTPLTELAFSGSDTLDSRFVNYVVYQAAADLIMRFLQGGSDFNTDLYIPLLREYKEQAAKELHNNVVYQIPCWIARAVEA